MGMATPFSGTGLGTDKLDTNIYRTGLGLFNAGVVFSIVEATISAGRTIAFMDPQVQIINGGVSDRDVTLPAALDGQTFYIINSGTTNVLTVKNAAGSTIGVVGINQAGIAISGDSTWRFLVTFGGSTAISATVAQLNTLAVTAGTVTASKAVVVDANKDVGTFRFVRAAQVVRSQGTPTSLATAGPATYTIAQLLTGIIVRDCAGASRTDTLPTAADLVAGIAGCAVGDTIETLIINGSDPTTEILTLDVGVGGAFDANQTAVSRTCLGTSSKLLRIRVTNIGSGTEAYVAYF